MWYTGSYDVCMYPKDKIIVNRDCQSISYKHTYPWRYRTCIHISTNYNKTNILMGIKIEDAIDTNR